MNEEVKEETEAEEEQAETAETMEEAKMAEEEKVEEPLEMEEESTEEILAEEEAKPAPKEERIKEEEIVEERIYTVPLRKAWIAPPNKRAPRAMRILKSFITRHMRLEARKEEREEEEEPKKLIVSNEVNERIWSRGIEKPPRKIRVRAAKDKEGNVTIYLAEGD